uniref:Uncharacterized protein n=1 Tax=Meloidogyne enterolobii TaxID=390850 RepID=A0A6V7V800_MELEN|nr:unnamed protein product [Meloidogyne enterolobii]
MIRKMKIFLFLNCRSNTFVGTILPSVPFCRVPFCLILPSVPFCPVLAIVPFCRCMSLYV